MGLGRKASGREREREGTLTEMGVRPRATRKEEEAGSGDLDPCSFDEGSAVPRQWNGQWMMNQQSEASRSFS